MILLVYNAVVDNEGLQRTWVVVKGAYHVVFRVVHEQADDTRPAQDGGFFKTLLNRLLSTLVFVARISVLFGVIFGVYNATINNQVLLRTRLVVNRTYDRVVTSKVYVFI